jgi:hypothetical protein
MIPVEIIGTPKKIGNLKIAQNVFSEEIDWSTAIQSCLDLGNGWRFPDQVLLEKIALIT